MEKHQKFRIGRLNGKNGADFAPKHLSDSIDDTVIIAGSDAYQAALIFYNAVKAAPAHIPGAKEVYSDLKARFPKVKYKKVE
ncbi:MAG: hypothetical protein LBK58_09675 [Prevotellaceae bacterium]|jgi:hypothetical protein|nr:hypothetical protein [Prevotellaceae bacterium]